MHLNQLKCQKAQPTAKPFKLADGNGLYLEVMPSGSKLWRLKYRFLGKENRLSLGAFPEVTLAEAREKRDQARKLLQSGVDPSMARKRERQQAILSAALTFELVAREWHENQSQIWTAQYSGSVLRRLELDVFPYIGRLPIADLNAPTLLAVLRRVEGRGAHEIAHRLLQTCGQICRYAIVTGRAERNPAADLRGALRPAPSGHYAALQAKDLPEFVRTLEQNDARLFLQTRLAIKLLMLTFVRTGELIGATWDEIDLDARQWVIPAARMAEKNKKFKLLIDYYKVGTEISYEVFLYKFIEDILPGFKVQEPKKIGRQDKWDDFSYLLLWRDVTEIVLNKGHTVSAACNMRGIPRVRCAWNSGQFWQAYRSPRPDLTFL